MPGCEYVPRCGGCQYQHANPAFQLQMKLDILKETLARAHLPLPGEIASLAGPPWGYRNRIRLHVMGPARWAIASEDRTSCLPVTHCPIAAPLLEQAIAAVDAHCEETSLDSLCEEVEFFTNGEQDQLLVSLWPGAAAAPHASAPWKHSPSNCSVQIPALTAWGSSRSKTDDALGAALAHLHRLRNPYQVSLGGFFQVNRFLLPALLQLAIEGAIGPAGLGPLLRRRTVRPALNFENVTAVESEGFSADDLKKNLARRPHRVVRSSTLDFLRSRPQAQEKPELDPGGPTSRRSGQGDLRASWRASRPRKSFIFPVILRPSPETCSHCYSLDIPCRR